MEACVSPAHRRQLPEKWEASPVARQRLGRGAVTPSVNICWLSLMRRPVLQRPVNKLAHQVIGCHPKCLDDIGYRLTARRVAMGKAPAVNEVLGAGVDQACIKDYHG